MFVLIDPAPSEQASATRSRFAVALVACERGTPRRFLVEEYARNAPEHEHLHYILDLYERWRSHVRKIAYESVGYQAIIGDALLTAARTRGISTLRPSMLIPLSRLRSEPAQEDRIRYALSPIVESGNFFLNRSHRLFIGEYDRFGVKGSKHDLLDAISNGPRVWGAGRGGRGGGNAGAAVDRARDRLRGADSTGY